MTTKKIIVIIVTFNRRELLLKVLKAVANQTITPFKVLVVDNNSNDGTELAVKELKENFIEYYNTGDNLGGAGGFEYGFKKASNYEYDYLWLMDDDFLPSHNCLEELIAAPGKGIAQPVRYNLDGSCAELSPVIYDLNSPFLLNPKKVSVMNQYSKLKEEKYLDIAGVPFEGPLISREVVAKIGNPNPKFFIFYDDLDYSIRTRNAGFSITCVYNARATRLLKNNQKNDLRSWKGYFMLRNLFYIHKFYGGNFLVRNKPALLCVAYSLLMIVKMDFKRVKVIINAYRDHWKLNNSELHKPK